MIFKGRCEGYKGNNRTCECKEFQKNEGYEYDEHGNLVEHVGYQEKCKPFKIVRYQYEYDRQGNWVKRVKFEGDNENSMTATEVLERKIEYY